MNKSTITPVAVAFTPNYLVPAATTLKSLIHASSGVFKVICLVSEEIPQTMQEELVRMGEGRLQFEYIPMKGRLNGIKVSQRYTSAAYFRLLLPEILPEYDTIVYMDCDIIVRQDIDYLYHHTNIGDNYLGVVYEFPIENQCDRIESIGLDPYRYFNSGFLLMNLAAMRKDNVSERLLKECEKENENLVFPDQDALNLVCRGHVYPLSPVYNSIRTFFLRQYRTGFVKQYSLPLWYEVQSHGNIHYTGREPKPWKCFTVKFGVWWRVFSSLPKKIRSEWTFPVGIRILGSIHRISFIDRLSEGLRDLYRRLVK